MYYVIGFIRGLFIIFPIFSAMEPKSIKQERETGKEELANQEASNDSRASSLVQGLTNQDASRATRSKGRLTGD